MYYSYNSQNTLEFVSLHDCFINHVVWQNNRLIIYLDWIDVMRNHPLNSSGKAKKAYNAAIIFDDALELGCFYYDLSKAYEEGRKINKQSYFVPEDAEMLKSTIAERCRNVEIDNLEERRDNGNRICRCLCHDDTEFEISFSNVWICFEKFGEDSWLECLPHNSKS